jgi:hypothetical protein
VLTYAQLIVNGTTIFKPPCYNKSFPYPNGYGDVDGDGYVLTADYVILYDEKCSDYTNGCQRADVDGNGFVGFNDVIEINEYIEGTRQTFPVCSM